MHNDKVGLAVGPANLTVMEGQDPVDLFLSLKTQPVHEVTLNLSVRVCI